VFQARRSSR